MAQINLAPGSQYILSARRRQRVLYGLTIVLAVITTATGIGLSFAVGQAQERQQAMQQELQSVETQIATASETVKKIQLFEQRLANLDQLLPNHRLWSLHLQEVERLLPPDTILTGLKGSHDTKTLELSGTASNIDSVAVALATLLSQEPGHPTLFKDGTVNTVGRVAQTNPAGEVIGQRYSFAMKLTF